MSGYIPEKSFAIVAETWRKWTLAEELSSKLPIESSWIGNGMNQEKSKSACLPAHGKINCTRCHCDAVVFDSTQRTDGDWRITANPLAWGNVNPEVLVLGFSKGPNALGALATKHHDLIPYADQRTWVKKNTFLCWSD